MAYLDDKGLARLWEKVTKRTPPVRAVTRAGFDALTGEEKGAAVYAVTDLETAYTPHLVAIQFSENLLGCQYTVQKGGEVYQAAVPEGLTTLVSVKEAGKYLVSCVIDGTTISEKADSSAFGPVTVLELVYMLCQVTVTVSGASASSVTARMGDTEVSGTPVDRTRFSCVVNRPGQWSFTAYSGDTALGGTVVTISQDQTSASAVIKI